MTVTGLIAKKIGMSQVFNSAGKAEPVTVLEVGPCVVTQIKTPKTDGYASCQLGFGHNKPKLVKKPQAGHLKGITQKPKVLAEVPVTNTEGLTRGQKIKVDELFAVGELVEISGTSKGKGFAGVVKRWNFHGGPKTHGQSDRQRAPGSIGSTTTPGRVYKGKKMAGHMGDQGVTVRGLKVIEIDALNNLIKVRGAVPGHKQAVVLIKKSKKNNKGI